MLSSLFPLAFYCKFPILFSMGYAHTSLLNWHISQKLIRRRNIHIVLRLCVLRTEQNKLLRDTRYTRMQYKPPKFQMLMNWTVFSVFEIWYCCRYDVCVSMFVLGFGSIWFWFPLSKYRTNNNNACLTFIAWHYTYIYTNIYTKSGTHKCRINIHMYMQTLLPVHRRTRMVFRWYGWKCTRVRQKLFNLTNKVRLFGWPEHKVIKIAVCNGMMLDV